MRLQRPVKWIEDRQENFTATAQLDYDWDNTPSPGNDRVDTRYLFNLGYGW